MAAKSSSGPSVPGCVVVSGLVQLPGA